jgi:hypothetical protein
MAKTKFFMDKLEEYSWEYIEECLENTKEQLSNKGDIREIKERNNPTIDFFLRIWIPRTYGKKATMNRATWYRWLDMKNKRKKTLIENIEKTFNALNLNIAANEGKGIAYLKHKFGWTDKIESKNEHTGNIISRWATDNDLKQKPNDTDKD